MDEKPTNRNWEIFTRRFLNSRSAVFKVAEYINREKNCAVLIPPLRLAPDPDFADDYKDNGDIIVNGKHIIEVKGKKLNFTDKDDFKFEDIIVANVQSADRHNAFAYFIVNQQMTHAAIIKGDTKNKWIISNIFEEEKKTWERKYLCPKNLVDFIIL